MNPIQELFVQIRDILYRVPLTSEEEDLCCTGKHKQLKKLLEDEGLQARWQVCTFKWSDIKLPLEVSSVPHEDDCTHAYLEVFINSSWKTVDATWDKGLSAIFPINEWDTISETPIAVPVLSIFSPEDSAEIIAKEDKEAVEADLKINGEFYKAFNYWLEETREHV